MTTVNTFLLITTNACIFFNGLFLLFSNSHTVGAFSYYLPPLSKKSDIVHDTDSFFHACFAKQNATAQKVKTFAGAEDLAPLYLFLETFS